MKYNHLAATPLKCCKISDFDGGTDYNAVKSNCLQESINMWHNSNRLQTRPGLSANGENVLIIEKEGNEDQFDYRLHDVTVNYLDSEYRIATVGVNCDDFMYKLYIYFAASGVNVLKVGELNFLRLSNEVFRIPDNITFFVGEPQTGGGVFALITLTNVENLSDKNYNIYEINSDFNGWERVYDYYVPTLLINGLGNRYDIAYSERKVDYKSEKALESQNLLNGRFHAYFTSDGYSDSFRLPVSDLSVESVVCRIYYAAGMYVEWNISGQSIVDTQSFMGSDIMLTVDHEMGILSFTKNGAPYAVPIMSAYSDNNIKVTASKRVEIGLEQVVDSTCSLSADGRVYLGGGKNGNILMSAKTDNPLYFPQGATTDIGGAEPITALSVQGKKLIVFKESETYCVTVQKGKRINEIGLIGDNDKLFRSSDTLVCDLASKTVGCRFKNTVCRVRDKTVWLSQNCEVYMLQSVGSGTVEKISDTLAKYADYDFWVSFAVSDGRHYILCDFGRAFVCDLKSFSEPKWYEWRFKQGFALCGGFYKKGKLWFWCDADGSGISYFATMDGDSDVKMYYDEDGFLRVEKQKVESFLLSSKYAISSQNHKNTIESIALALSGRGKLEIKINGRSQALIDMRLSAEEYDKGEYKSVILRPHLYDTRQLQFYIASDSEFAIGEIEIFYRKTG